MIPTKTFESGTSGNATPLAIRLSMQKKAKSKHSRNKTHSLTSKSMSKMDDKEIQPYGQ